MEKLRKKNIRRIAPAGEDLKKIREIIRNAAPDLTVQEFVGTISPYTGDNGSITLQRDFKNQTPTILQGKSCEV